MNRFVRIPLTFVACTVWAGFALAQAPPGQGLRHLRRRGE
jgi:hypothetical protein